MGYRVADLKLGVKVTTGPVPQGVSTRTELSMFDGSFDFKATKTKSIGHNISVELGAVTIDKNSIQPIGDLFDGVSATALTTEFAALGRMGGVSYDPLSGDGSFRAGLGTAKHNVYFEVELEWHEESQTRVGSGLAQQSPGSASPAGFQGRDGNGILRALFHIPERALFQMQAKDCPDRLSL